MIIGNFPAGGGSIIKSIQTFAATSGLITINEVNMNNSIITMNKQSGYSATAVNKAYFVNSTSIAVSGASDSTIAATVIEFADGVINSIQSISTVASLVDVTVTINSVNTSKTWLIPNSSCDCNAAWNLPTPACNLVNSTTLSIKDHSNDSRVQIVEFK